RRSRKRSRSTETILPQPINDVREGRVPPRPKSFSHRLQKIFWSSPSFAPADFSIILQILLILSSKRIPQLAGKHFQSRNFSQFTQHSGTFIDCRTRFERETSGNIRRRTCQSLTNC